MVDTDYQNSLEDDITLIITTSPTLSAPSTELLAAVLNSFQAHCSAVLSCKVILVFDSYDKVATDSRLKKGYVTEETASVYDEYKKNSCDLLLRQYGWQAEVAQLRETRGEAEYGSPDSTKPVDFTIKETQDGKIKFVEAIGQRLGFGLAVRTALRLVDTPYVWVHQHDWALTQDIPISEILRIMTDAQSNPSEPIRYICLPSGRRASYATSDQVTAYPELHSLSLELTADYSPQNDPSAKVPLTPMFFWHDKPHIAETAHYLQRVFPSRFSISRGDFIEDSVGQIARNQMKAGQWAKWATWLYNPASGNQVCLRHLHGRTWRGVEHRPLAI